MSRQTKKWMEGEMNLEQLKKSATRSPFLWKWILDEVRKRKDPRSLLTLYRVLNPKVNLKNFAQEHKIAYGTVRNWVSFSHFKEAEIATGIRFACLFVEELERLFPSDQDKYECLISEAVFYPLILRYLIAKFVMERIKKIIDNSECDPLDKFNAMATFLPFITTHGRLFEKPFEEKPEEYAKLLKNIDNVHKEIISIFLSLNDSRPEIADFLKNHICHLIDERSRWQIAYYTKKERRRGRKKASK